MSEQTIKNPFGDSISMSQAEEDINNDNNLDLSHSNTPKNDYFQEETIKKKIS